MAIIEKLGKNLVATFFIKEITGNLYSVKYKYKNF